MQTIPILMSGVAQSMRAGESMAVVQLRASAGTETIKLPENGELKAGGGLWSCRTSTSPVAGRDNCDEVTITIRLLEGASKGACVGYACDLDNWDPCGYILVPAIVYNGNKFEVFGQGYPPLWRDKSRFRIDMPVTITDQPRLNKDGSPGCIELDTGNAAAPAIGFRSPDGRGFLLVTLQRCEFGNLGLTIEEDGKNHHLRILVSAPRMRSRVPNMMGFRQGDSPRDWKPGDTATFRLHLWRFQAPSLQTLFDHFAICRKDLNVSHPKNEIPFSEAWRLLQEKHNTLNWNEDLGFYCHNNSLFKLWRATGDEFSLDLIRDIAHGAPQYLSRADQPVGGLKPGMICERVNLSDWEGENNVGGSIFGSSAWPEIATMLTTAEIPGIYVNKDKGRVVVFDHVEASLDSNGKKLIIRNPTKFDARVKVLCETTEQASRPLGIWTLKNARTVDIPAAGGAEISLK